MTNILFKKYFGFHVDTEADMKTFNNPQVCAEIWEISKAGLEESF